MAHITVMLEGTLWVSAGIRPPRILPFSRSTTIAFGQGMPLEMLYNRKGDRLFVTTAKPGHVNIYDNSHPQRPKFLQTIPRLRVHHLVLSPDEHTSLSRTVS